MNDIKERNRILFDNLIDHLVALEPLIPMRDLVLFCHITSGLGYEWGRSSDTDEKMNYKRFNTLNPHFDDQLQNAMINASFKPDSFVHRFEDHYTLPGYLDKKVLPFLFSAVDKIAGGKKSGHVNVEGDKFLSFVYVVFLLIHPFIDGNGRVARNVLDYYNKVLHLGLNDVWNSKEHDQHGKFSNHHFHKKAFKNFYKREKLPQIPSDELYSHSAATKSAHKKMAKRLKKWAQKAKKQMTVPQPKCVKIMAKAIKGP